MTTFIKKPKYFPMGPTSTLIAEIIGVPESPRWNIVDSDIEQGLYLVHYHPNAILTEDEKNIKGILVDINRRHVYKMYGHNSIMTSKTIPLSKDEKNIEFQPDVDKAILTPLDKTPQEKILLPLDRVTMVPGFNGALLAVVKINGKVYVHTHRKISYAKSRWGNSKTMKEMWEECKGPDVELLYDSQCIHSPFIYYFLLVHPGLQTVSKAPVEIKKVLYVGMRQAYDRNTHPDLKTLNDKGESIVESVSRIPTEMISPVKLMSSITQNPVLKIPESVSLTPHQANEFLLTGYYHSPELDIMKEKSHTYDPRTLPGESIVIFLKDEQGNVTRTFSIESPSYKWRRSIRGDIPNLLLQFFNLTKDQHFDIESTKDVCLEKYFRKYPLVHKTLIHKMEKGEYTPSYLDEDIPWSTDILPYFYNRRNRLTNIWVCFILALPCHQQNLAYSFLNNYDQAVNNVIHFLINRVKKTPSEAPENGLCKTSRHYWEFVRKDIRNECLRTHPIKLGKVKKISLVNEKSLNRSVDRMIDIILNTYSKTNGYALAWNNKIKAFVHREHGSTLYAMNKLINRLKEV